MTAMMFVVAFLACVEVCFVHFVECFLKDSLGDMRLSLQEYMIRQMVMIQEE